MVTTSPDSVWTPDSGSQYALTQDLAAMADTIQAAFVKRANLFVGTKAQREAFRTTAPEGVHWQDTNDAKLEWVKKGTAWEPAVVVPVNPVTVMKFNATGLTWPGSGNGWQWTGGVFIPFGKTYATPPIVTGVGARSPGFVMLGSVADYATTTGFNARLMKLSNVALASCEVTFVVSGV